jgi:5'-3' exonuclease
MGVKHLNRYLTETCSSYSIRKMGFVEMRNQTVVVDTSIYLYKFIEKGDLEENMYLMMSLFREYAITPIFVFDGKPPPEKKELLERRRAEKRVAETKYNELCATVIAPDGPGKTDEIVAELAALKKRFVRIHERDIQTVKRLITAYGMTYLESKGEADQLCAYLTKHSYAWGCMSDDRDMFLYGCPRVIRHVSLLNHSAVVYDTSRILKELGMGFSEFKDIMVLSGTDYILGEKTSLADTLKLYALYKILPNNPLSFYDWLSRCTNYITDRPKLDRVHLLFDLSSFSEANPHEISAILRAVPFRNRPLILDEIRQIMEPTGFVFLCM